MKKKIKLSKKLLGTALAIGLGTSLAANSISTPQPASGEDALFSMVELSSHQNLLSNDDHQCGEGKCGEHECGEDSGDDDHDEPSPPKE